MRWIHDGSLEGFLATVWDLLHSRDKEPWLAGPSRVEDGPAPTRAEPELFDCCLGPQDLTPGLQPALSQGFATRSKQSQPAPGQNLPSSGPGPADPRGKALHLEEVIRHKAGESAWATLRDAFWNSTPAKDMDLLAFIRLLGREGRSAIQMEARPCVRRTLDWAKSTRRELHLFMGILRFQRLGTDQGWYAAMEPDHHIILLLARHFLPRMGESTWYIHDIRRGLLLGNNSQGLELFEGVELDRTLPLSEDEPRWQAAWQRFFTSTAIPQRRNPLLQRGHVPQKYWKHLVERPQEVPGSAEKKPGQP